MTPNEPDLDNLLPIDDIDLTIHAPTRLKILVCLSIVECVDFTFLLHQTRLTRGNLSPNLRKLEEANFIQINKEFVDRVPRTLIRLTDEGRAALQNYRDKMQFILNELLGD